MVMLRRKHRDAAITLEQAIEREDRQILASVIARSKSSLKLDESRQLLEARTVDLPSSNWAAVVGMSRTTLVTAAQDGNEDELNRLLDGGADINSIESQYVSCSAPQLLATLH